jgi:hypothetical protein
VTSGGQLIESASALRSLGAIVSDALCAIDREAGGAATLKKADITLHSLFRMTELKATAAEARRARAVRYRGPRAVSRAGNTSRAQSVCFQPGTGVEVPTRGTNAERSTSWYL